MSCRAGAPLAGGARLVQPGKVRGLGLSGMCSLLEGDICKRLENCVEKMFDLLHIG